MQRIFAVLSEKYFLLDWSSQSQPGSKNSGQYGLSPWATQSGFVSFEGSPITQFFMGRETKQVINFNKCIKNLVEVLHFCLSSRTEHYLHLRLSSKTDDHWFSQFLCSSWHSDPSTGQGNCWVNSSTLGQSNSRPELLSQSMHKESNIKQLSAT